MGCQLLTRERSHLAGDPKNAMPQGHQLGIGRETRDTLCPRKVVNRGGQYRGAILIARNQYAGSLNPGDMTSLLAPFGQHM